LPVQGITKFGSSKEDSATYSYIKRVFQILRTLKKYKQPALFYVANYIPDYLGPNCWDTFNSRMYSTTHTNEGQKDQDF